jgi:LPXTG-motif cell wall-anchored protein
VNLFKLRRATTVVGGSFLGLTAVGAMAVPALACHTPINAVSACVNADKTWVVTWKVSNSESNSPGTITGVQALPSADTISFTGISAGDQLPSSRDGSLTGVQTLSADADSASIKISAHWDLGRRSADSDIASYPVNKPRQKCDSTPPTKPPTAPPTAPPTSPTNTPPTKVTTPPEGTTPPATETTAPPTTGTTAPPTTTPPAATPTPSLPVPTESVPAEAKPILTMDCDSITIGLDNPAEGVTYKLHFKPSTGAERDLTIAPGEKKSETFAATTGFKVAVTVTTTIGGQSYSETETIDYVKPATCTSGGGGLPLTGAASSTMAGGAVVVLAAGWAIFYLARRRKVKFTA